MKTDAEMKGIVSMSHAGDRNGHYNRYHWVGGTCTLQRLPKDRLELGEKERDSIACFLLNMDASISVCFIFSFTDSIDKERSSGFVSFASGT